MIDIRRMLQSKPRTDEHELEELETRWTRTAQERLRRGEPALLPAAESGPEPEPQPGSAAGAIGADGSGTPGDAPRPDIPAIVDAHPRPQFAREGFTVLDGEWECAFVPFDYDSCQRRAYVAAFASYMDRPTHVSAGRLKAAGWEVVASPHTRAQVEESFEGSDPATVADDPIDAFFWRALPRPEALDRRILVPFSPEAPASGVGRQLQPDELLWYRRTFQAERPRHAQRFMLHFDGVDFACGVFLNGTYVGGHLGAYAPFALNVTSWVRDGVNTLEVVAWDQSENGTQLRGKQQLARGGIWYTAQSGIWQSVWYEVVPEWCVSSLELEPDAQAGCVHALVRTTAPGAALTVQAFNDRGEPAGEAVSSDHAAADGSFQVDVPVRAPQLWSPDDPRLYYLAVSYGEDRAYSYCGFRTVGVEPDAQGVPRFFLNGEPLFVRGVLYQGIWPDGLLTAPTDDALAYDIRKARELGFNTMRVHVKVERDRFYYHCDRLGMLVWQDMPNGGGVWNERRVSTLPALWRPSWTSVRDDRPQDWAELSAGDPVYRKGWTAQCRLTVHRLRSHPCIVEWTLFNEGWGQFDSAAAVEEVRSIDPTRPIDAASGWFDQGAGDFQSVHNYFRKLRVYPDKKAGPAHQRAFVLTEFGGIAHAVQGHCAAVDAYGYQSAADRDEWKRRVRQTLDAAEALQREGCAGYVYTQLTDVEEEVNGLLTYDREVDKTK